MVSYCKDETYDKSVRLAQQMIMNAAIMAQFTVTQIIDGDTFDVSPGWNWKGSIGSRVRPTGYNTPETGAIGAAAATTRLHQLIGGRIVELGNAYRIDRGRLVCDVFINGRDLASYFPDFRT